MASERHWDGNKTPGDLWHPSTAGWGNIQADDGKHKSGDQVMGMLEKVKGMHANLLLNTRPLPDGHIHPEDMQTVKG